MCFSTVPARAQASAWESGARMNRLQFVNTLGAGLGLVFVPRLPRWRADDVFVERWSWVMGQPVHVMVFASSEQEGLDACAAALAELRRVERRLTLFDAASDLCELNRRAGRKRMRVDEDLRLILAQAGGFTAFAARSRIVILRAGDKRLERISFNYNKAFSDGEAQNIELRPGDIVLVP